MKKIAEAEAEREAADAKRQAMYTNSAPTGIEEKVQIALGIKGEEAQKASWAKKEEKAAAEATQDAQP